MDAFHPTGQSKEKDHKDSEKPVPVKDLIEEPEGPAPDPAEELAILCPAEKPIKIAGRSLTVRKPKLRALIDIAKEVAEVFWAVFASTEGEGQAGGAADYLLNILPSAVKVMARTLNVEPDWLQDNAGLLEVSTWLRIFLDLYPDSELRAIRENFTQAFRRIKKIAPQAGTLQALLNS